MNAANRAYLTRVRYKKYVNGIIPKRKKSVHFVIPDRDPESRKHPFVNKVVAYTGFRVSARNDGVLPTSQKRKYVFRLIADIHLLKTCAN